MAALPPLVRITAVEVVGEHELRLTFEDDTEWRGVFEPLRDPAQFAQVFVDEPFGTITWPNGLDMAPEPLYEEARRRDGAPSPGRLPTADCARPEIAPTARAT